jgi:hypothetical protein
VDESTVDESTEVGVPTEVGGLITIGDPTEEETPTEVETPAEPETPAKPEVPAKVETPVTVEEPLPTEASSVPESVPELVEPIELGDAVSTFSFGTNMSRNWTTSASNKQKCIVIGRTERNGSASVRDIIIDWGEGAAQSLSGIGVYTSAGAQTYNKVCHTYASAKEYGVHITTPDRVAYLDLSSQNVNAFEAGTWGTNLIYLSLDDNDLYSLAGGAFRGLTKLEKLYLSNNAFSALPPDLFQGLTMLKVIELSRNNLTALPDTIFNGLTALVDLDLSYNALGANSISAALLTNLNNLEIVALAGNGLSVLPSAFVSGRTKLTDLYFYENNLLELPSLAGLTKLRVVSAFDTALDTSGYNAFLNTFKTIPTATGALYASPASYGGCVANASLGIAGHTTLTTVPNIWVVNDAGLESCVISGSLAYSPDTTVWTNSGVVATLTLDTTGTVSSAGWTPSGAGTIFTKTYISNTGETVNFVSPSGATGSASVVISSIINSGSLGAIVSYTPAQNASGDITVTVTLNTTGGVAPIHWSATGAYAYTRIYTTTTLQSEETFSDVAGNTIETQINLTIDRDAPVATNVSYSPHTVTNSGVTVTLTTNEVVVKPSTRS